MADGRKSMLVIASWYPSKDNPIAGTFFKEQCELLSSVYDVTVLKINSYSSLFLKYCAKRISGRDISIEPIGQREGLREYDIHVYRPMTLALKNNLYGRFTIKRKGLAGLGSVDCKAEKKFWKTHMERLINKIDGSYDLVYGISAQGTAVYAMLLAQTLGVPYILSEHSPFMIPGTSLNDTFKTSVEGASAFLAISKDKVRQILMQNIKLKRICYMGNMIDDEKFSFRPSPHDDKTFLIVAANSFYKNYDLFIKTMDRLSEIATVPFKVIVAGYGANKGYSQAADELLRKIRGSKFSDRVELIPEVSREDIPLLYNRADAFVMTSIQEGQPVAAIEAACSGLPVFSTRCGGVEDYVDDSMGRIVGILDYKELADHMNDFLSGSVTYNGRHIHEKTAELFGKNNYLKKFTDIVNEVTGQSHE